MSRDERYIAMTAREDAKREAEASARVKDYLLIAVWVLILGVALLTWLVSP